ncbi:Uncharacterised protein [Mycobacteroides abscessus subsp. abscessus]|nr:Uncharacterised protein [Mycobacteroides abscessus subsp. abscessus]
MEGITITNEKTYVIELDKWGIKNGVPTKPYTNDHYILANNNITGINNALSWANSNGYNYVMFPRGEYALCFPNPIYTKDNMTIDFNNSTFRVIYDSSSRSPFDKSSNPFYKFGGNSIVCTTSNTHIINLTLIGDRLDRSWNDPKEKSMEFSSGIVFGSGADNSSVRHCNLSHYMGDAIVTGFGPYSSFDIGMTEIGAFDLNGLPIASSTGKTVRSVNFINLPTDIKSFTMVGLGYSPTTSIPSGMYNVYFYSNNGTFLSMKSNIRTRDRVFIPKNAGKIKLSWEGNGTIDDGTLPNNPPYWCLLIKGGLAENLLIEYNEVHRCHRGGVVIGTNNVMVRKNYFHNTGEPGTSDIDSLPTFTDFTRYALCTEDNVGHNCKFIDNVFYNTRLAIATRGDYNEIVGNEFRNCVYGIILYNLKHCNVQNNYFHFSGFTCFNYQNLFRDWIINNNIFIGSKVNFEGSGFITSFTSNTFDQVSTFESSVKLLVFKDNVFKDNSGFLNYGGKYSKTVIKECSFINSYVSFVSIPDRLVDVINDCYFENSYVRYQSNYQVIIRNSTFINSSYLYGSTLPTAIYTLINCKIGNKTVPLIYATNAADMGITRAVLDISNCNISLGTKPMIEGFSWGSLKVNQTQVEFSNPPSVSSAIFSGYGNITDLIDIKNTTLMATDPNTKHSLSSVKKVVLVDNNYKNFEFINANVPIQTVDIEVPYIRIPIKGNTPPKSPPEYIGQLFIDTSLKQIYMAVGTTSVSDWILMN